jgi:hypothetical protein
LAVHNSSVLAKSQSRRPQPSPAEDNTAPQTGPSRDRAPDEKLSWLPI